MPELPDLQVFSRNLTRRLAGKKVKKIHAIYKKKLKTPEKELQRALVETRLSSVVREGKELHFYFDNGNTLAVHLMLRGELKYFEKGGSEKHAIIEIVFENDTGLAITDFLKQAVVTLNPGPRQAPDALSPQAGYRFLKTALAASRAPIKKLLTNQDVIRGIGNAYADEILWDARISPFSISNKIPDANILRLSKSIRSVCGSAAKSIQRANPEIIGGEVRDFLKIHNPERTHSPGGAKILVAQSGGRKTYYTDEQTLWK